MRTWNARITRIEAAAKSLVAAAVGIDVDALLALLSSSAKSRLSAEPDAGLVARGDRASELLDIARERRRIARTGGARR